MALGGLEWPDLALPKILWFCCDGLSERGRCYANVDQRRTPVLKVHRVSVNACLLLQLMTLKDGVINCR